MRARAESNLIMRFMVACSLFGWCTVLLMVIFPHATMQEILWRKPFVGSLIFLICAGGSMAAVSPRACSATHRAQMVETSNGSSIQTGIVSSLGHHPDCGEFSDHTIRVMGNSYCAACTGLLIGGVMAMSVTILYFFLGLNAEAMGFPALLMGQFGPALGLLQFKFKGWIRLSANVLFVLGSCLILVGIDKLEQNMFADVYLTGLIILWILTRIMISQWDHCRICFACGFSCATERKVGVSASSS